MSQNSDVNLQSTFGFHSRQENKRYLTSYISQKSKMVEATTIVKALGTAIALPGLFMTLIGLGVVPVDESMGQIADIFIEPLSIPLKPFFCVLGPCKILGALSLWNIGPMPQWFGRIGLIIASLCGGYGHYTIGEPVFGPVAYIGLMGSLYYLDPITMMKGKKE